MPNLVTVQGTAIVVHRKASSACCDAKVRLAPEDAEHEHECVACEQPATRVLGEPRHIPAGFGGEFPAEQVGGGQ